MGKVYFVCLEGNEGTYSVVDECEPVYTCTFDDQWKAAYPSEPPKYSNYSSKCDHPACVTGSFPATWTPISSRTDPDHDSMARCDRDQYMYGEVSFSCGPE